MWLPIQLRASSSLGTQAQSKHCKQSLHFSAIDEKHPTQKVLSPVQHCYQHFNISAKCHDAPIVYSLLTLLQTNGNMVTWLKYLPKNNNAERNALSSLKNTAPLLNYWMLRHAVFAQHSLSCRALWTKTCQMYVTRNNLAESVGGGKLHSLYWNYSAQTTVYYTGRETAALQECMIGNRNCNWHPQPAWLYSIKATLQTAPSLQLKWNGISAHTFKKQGKWHATNRPITKPFPTTANDVLVWIEQTGNFYVSNKWHVLVQHCYKLLVCHIFELLKMCQSKKNVKTMTAIIYHYFSKILWSAQIQHQKNVLKHWKMFSFLIQASNPSNCC